MRASMPAGLWDQARCADPKIPVSVFFPTRNHHTQRLRAYACCHRCPIRPDCIAYGIDETSGIWGATIPEDRKHIRHTITTTGQSLTTAVTEYLATERQTARQCNICKRWWPRREYLYENICTDCR